ncbi:MAG: cytochrome c biogenesis protein CcsA [Chthoniobacter sp.]|nr:cytochrome c biogenesis protein CcsA [Chthoniobacter sp.]
MKKLFPWIIFAVFAAYAAGGLRPAKVRDFDWEKFGRLPVMANGRFQPLDSLARNALLQLREKGEAISSTALAGPDQQRKMTATEWLTEVMFKPEVAEARPNIRIDNLELKQTLALPVEPDETKNTDGKHFSYAQIRPQFAALQEQARQAAGVKPELQSPYQRAVLQLLKQVQLFWRMENLAQPRVTDVLAGLKGASSEGAEDFLKMADEVKPQNAADWKAEMNAFLDGASAGRAALMASRDGKPHDEKVLTAFKRDLVRLEAMSMKGQPLLIPSADPVGAPEAWRGTGDALMSAASGSTPHPALHAYAQMGDAFRAGRAADFNAAAADYLAQLQPQFGAVTTKAVREQTFNRVAPFTHAMAIYVAVALCAICFWFAPVSGEWLRRTAVLLCLLALVIHAGGLVTRMVLEGRPPVTNLYSAAVFIGFAACVLGLVLEMVWRNSIGIIVSAVIGFITLLIAHHLALAGDTMEMMRAVLDTNFWLATHVVIVTLGYASTYVAGFLGILFVIIGIFTTRLTTPFTRNEAIAVTAATAVVSLPLSAMMAVNTLPATAREVNMDKAFAKMIYAITCFASLFSFVGTVLGGIWADQSWGRFWGWDPKENGALIIVLWNILILHARWGGMVRERGLANLAIVGNIVTTWSFFGTNMLGVGLHSYGFMDQERVALIAFVVSQLVLIAFGSLPLRVWRSYGGEKTDPPAGGTPQAA